MGCVKEVSNYKRVVRAGLIKYATCEERLDKNVAILSRRIHRINNYEKSICNRRNSNYKGLQDEEKINVAAMGMNELEMRGNEVRERTEGRRQGLPGHYKEPSTPIKLAATYISYTYITILITTGLSLLPRRIFLLIQSLPGPDYLSLPLEHLPELWQPAVTFHILSCSRYLAYLSFLLSP